MAGDARGQHVPGVAVDDALQEAAGPGQEVGAALVVARLAAAGAGVGEPLVPRKERPAVVPGVRVCGTLEQEADTCHVAAAARDVQRTVTSTVGEFEHIEVGVA